MSDKSYEPNLEGIFEDIFEALPHMIFVKEASELRFTLLNRAGEDLLGLKREDLIGKNDYDFFPDDQAKFFQDKDRSVLDSGKPFLIEEEPIETPNGRRFLRTKKVPILGSDKKPLYLLGISEDITDTRQQDSFVKDTIDRLPAVFFSKDLDGRYIMVNEGFRALFDLKDEEIVKKSDHDLFPKDIADQFRENDLNIIQHKKLEISEERVKDKDGAERVYQSYKYPYLDDEGNVRATGGVALDVTKTKDLERQAHLSSKLAAIGELASGVGHEINNPLAIANGIVERLKRTLSDKGLSDAEIDRSFQKYFAATKRIINIVDGLRSFARSDSAEKGVFDIAESVVQSVGLIKEIYRQDGVAVEMVVPKTGISVFGNLGRFQQAFMNLLSNSKDALSNVERPLITVSVIETDGRVRVTVEDNGCGIPKEIKNKVFESFFTTKEIGKGTGMGLSLSASFVREDGGSIDFSSTAGEGSEFWIDYPVSGGSPETASHKDEGEDAVDFNKIPRKALVVDDEPMLREILRDYLESIGVVDVVEAGNGEEALNALEKTQGIEVVFSDVKMPVMDGITLVKKIDRAAMGGAKPLRVVVVTGGVSDDFKTIESLIDGKLEKPFGPNDISDLFDKWQGA